MSESNVRRGEIRWPNERGAAQQVYQAALQEAWSTGTPPEQVFDFQLHGGVAEQGNDAVMVWTYSFQVVGPGGQASARNR
jgi:hypothetical protein